MRSFSWLGHTVFKCSWISSLAERNKLYTKRRKGTALKFQLDDLKFFTGFHMDVPNDQQAIETVTVLSGASVVKDSAPVSHLPVDQELQNTEDNVKLEECKSGAVIAVTDNDTIKNIENDANQSKRWRRQRRRGRLHKRQLVDGCDAPGTKEAVKRAKIECDDEDSASFGKEAFAETDYYFEHGLRKVYPYQYTFLVYCKERWAGKTILEMLDTEFLSSSSPDHHRNQIQRCAVKVNGRSVEPTFILKGKNELISNTVHRHELPVTADEIKIIEDNESVLVIDKPSSIPVHPCGRYRHNSAIFILGKEYGYTHLRTLYRLDRLTSGLLIFCKTHSQTNHMMQHIKDRQVSKVYLCRVVGEFPEGKIECCEPLDLVHHKIGTWRVKKGGKESHTTFERLSYNGTSSVVQCWPHTGRTHQIRVHLQFLGYPILNDPLYNDVVWGPNKGKNGDYGKSDAKLYEDLLKVHTDKNYESCHADEPPSIDPSTSVEAAKLAVDPDCEYCQKTYRDPKPHQLVMYLHALSYKGPDWEYKTSAPEWANSEWIPPSN